MKNQQLYDLLSQVQPLTKEAIADVDVLVEEKRLKKNQLLIVNATGRTITIF